MAHRTNTAGLVCSQTVIVFVQDLAREMNLIGHQVKLLCLFGAAWAFCQSVALAEWGTASSPGFERPIAIIAINELGDEAVPHSEQVQVAAKGSHTNRLISAGVPSLPTPARVDPKVLPAGFGKSAPASITDLRNMERFVEGLAARVSPTVVEVEVGNSSGSG